MSLAAAVACTILVVAWAVLVIVAHLLNPEQSPLTMGVSGLARGRVPWVLKSSFLCRGASALLLLIAVPGVLGTGGITLAGITAFWVWGVGSAILALIDTDMPGESPTRAGAAHALVALVAYIAGVTGAILLSWVVMKGLVGTSAAVWALPLALTAAVFLVLQFLAFGAAAREAGASVPQPAAPQTDATPSPAAAGQAAAPPLSGAPPQLTATGSAGAGARPVALSDLAGYAGLFQRVFLALIMLWTLLVALGIGSR